MKRQSWIYAGVAAAVAFGLGGASPARACMNGVLEEVEWQVEEAHRAERLLRAGNIRGALRRAGWTIRRLRGSSQNRGIRLRLERVLAVSTVRLEGRVDRRRWRARPDASASQRRGNLIWAREIFAERVAGTQATVVDRARLAEAMVALGQNEEALAILSDLRDRDVLPDPRAYATLARAHHALGQNEARERARRGCEAIASRRQRLVCPSFPRS